MTIKTCQPAYLNSFPNPNQVLGLDYILSPDWWMSNNYALRPRSNLMIVSLPTLDLDIWYLPMSTRAVSLKAKSRRTSRACDFCHKRSHPCKKETESSLQCITCIEFGVACTWSRVPAKRGIKPRSSNRAALWTLSETKHGSIELIEKLIDNFFEAVYPAFVLFFRCYYHLLIKTKGYNDPRADV